MNVHNVIGISLESGLRVNQFASGIVVHLSTPALSTSPMEAVPK